MPEANTMTTPIDPNVKLVKDNKYSKKVDPIHTISVDGGQFTT